MEPRGLRNVSVGGEIPLVATHSIHLWLSHLREKSTVPFEQGAWKKILLTYMCQQQVGALQVCFVNNIKIHLLQ